MKQYFKLTLLCWGLSLSYANAQVGMPTNNPNKNAVLDLNRTDGTSAKGLLLPNVALTAINNFAPMTAHVAGMHVWNTATAGSGVNAVTPGEYYNNGSKWIRVASSTDAWIQGGNNNGALKFIGTNDAFDLPIETNSVERMRITSGGKIGIGTTAPSNNLEISGTNGTATGLKLPTGASSGKVLTSDPDGNAVWQSSAIQLQTVVTSSGGQKFFPSTGAMTDWKLIDFFSVVVEDDAKTIYGSTYGWNTTTNSYKVPRDGKYRISMNMYTLGAKFGGSTVGDNWRIATIFNNANAQVSNPAMPFISLTVAGDDQTVYTSGIVTLKVGDIINFKSANYSGARSVSLYGAGGHSVITIESL
ncbi:hypothetical protein [Flavobacterium notoginsengisoli]|uniref:hypothetical protein n=1 Tax=Flavobacterium notoginsengisoli TaxID=1478199 RepID=UPI003628D848